jgi:hypothetical protein
MLPRQPSQPSSHISTGQEAVEARPVKRSRMVRPRRALPDGAACTIAVEALWLSAIGAAMPITVQASTKAAGLVAKARIASPPAMTTEPIVIQKPAP